VKPSAMRMGTIVIMTRLYSLAGWQTIELLVMCAKVQASA
jgi:hypothetical protein